MRPLHWLTIPLAVALLSPAAPRRLVGTAATLPAQQDTTAKKKKQAKRIATPDADAAGKSVPGGRDRRKTVRDSIAAEARPLFASRDPLPFTLIADFRAISRNRDSTSKVRHAGTLVVKDADGSDRRIPVELQTRGHYRLKSTTCRFVNLLVRFPDKGKLAKGTPFDGQKSLKLGGHCQDDARYERLLRREHLAYRILNVITPRSFRTRLSLGTYLDSASNRQVASRLAMWIENEDDVADRQGATMRELKRALFADLEPRTLDQMALFEYLIGNTDWSIYALHNIRLVSTDSGTVYPIPYDFDFSGLVNAPYAAPPPQLGLRNVRERVYRGPCRRWDEVAPSIARFVEHEGAIRALLKEPPRLEEGEARDLSGFLDSFFHVARDPGDARQAFVDRCLDKPGA
ncbi:MAG: hypothetical protein ABI910_04270 [Gemmatimonadota bacterium]